MQKRLWTGALLAAVGLIIIQLPDIRRYLRIRSM